MANQNHILFGVLNWGLGHATRSIPVINALLKKEFTVTIATDGLALRLLQKEFPTAQFLALKNPEILYSKRGNQVFALAKSALKIRRWYTEEQKTITNFLAKNVVNGIITDNRPSVFSPNIPSVYLTHQCNVQAGIFGGLATALHKSLYKKFTQIWVPDVETQPKISGFLGGKTNGKNVKYIGLLSDLKPTNEEKTFDVAVILSGPEPQRSLLENALVAQLKNTNLHVMLLRGTTLPAAIQIPKKWFCVDLASRAEVQTAFSTSQTIIARCGYSTLMDLYNFPKPAILIPTPGQPEQEYLAKLPLHKSTFEIQTQEKLDVVAGLARAQKAFEHFKPLSTAPNWDVLLGNLFSKNTLH